MEYSILVVDDQASNIKFISLLLKEMGLGKKIYSAPNGRIALELIENTLPDLVLSDWGMPEMNGLELLKALKSSEKTKDIPFIMVSAVRIDAESMKESFDAGVHDYLRKPFDKLEFKARVTATLKLQGAYLEIKRSKNEIENQSLMISKQHEELRKLNKLKDKIFSIISHDVRSPLATLYGLLNIFNDDEIELNEEDLKEFTTSVQLELNSVQSLMDNLLYWAKSQLTNKEIGKTSVNLYEVTQEIFNLFNEKAKSKNIDFHNNINPGSTIYGDENVLSFVIRNLFANAVKYTSEGGSITVDREDTNEFVMISVEDTGTGMDSETIGNLFKDKTESSMGTSGELGTGVGLMLCKELIQQNKGSIQVKSQLGKGSVFSFTVPIENEYST